MPMPVDRLDVFHGRAANGRWTLNVARPAAAEQRHADFVVARHHRSSAMCRQRRGRHRSRRENTSPPSAHAPGANGTSWQTDVRIFNRGSGAGERHRDLHARRRRRLETLRRGEAVDRAAAGVALDDVVATRCRRAASASSSFSATRIALVITSRTYTTAPERRNIRPVHPGGVDDGCVDACGRAAASQSPPTSARTSASRK